jgi:hypothetical protein
MLKWLLSLALGAGCLACAVENAPRVRQSADDDADGEDDGANDFAGDAEDAPTSPPRTRVDAGVRRDGGMGIDSGVRRRDAGPILCVDGGTVPATGGGASEVGTSCAVDGDCGDGARCLTEVMLPFGNITLSYPGGYCTKACTADDACGDGASCPLAAAASFASDLSNCMQNCETQDDCRDGYSCGTVPSFGGMAPASPQKTCLPPTPAGLPSGGGLPGGSGAPPAP